MVLQGLKAFLDGFFGQTVHPKSLDGTLCRRLLHNPTLYEFTFLTSITAVDDFIGLLEKSFDDVELLLDAFVFFEFDAESRRNHGQLTKAPTLPHRRIFVWLLQLAKVSESPRHLISIAFQVTVLLTLGTQDIRYFTRHRGFLGYTNNHNL